MTKNNYRLVVLIAAAILMIVMGARQSLDLFVHPLLLDTGLSIASISFAMAVSQLVWGAVQPLFGIVAARLQSRCCGPARRIIASTVLASTLREK